MREVRAWIDRHERREGAVLRLEDALIGGRFGRYFFYRLRFFVARTAISTIIHAIKIVLLLGAFPRNEFVVIVLLQSGLALGADAWWGALEELRGRVRTLQRRAARHLIARQIGRWLWLAAVLAFAGLVGSAVFVATQLVAGRLSPLEALAAAMLVGGSLDLVARTYHSGAYAMRRVYRPLPSLLALDVVSVGVLLALFPFIGLWAFPLAELVSALTVVSISIHFTSRTYRSLALPTLGTLLRAGRLPPSLAELRAGLTPGLAYALVGLEGLVVIAGTFGAMTVSGESLVALLAALAPVNRASFEWARLMYFDLKRLELPLLAGLRRRFDRATLGLALVVALFTGAIAVAVGVAVLFEATPLLVAGLLALFVARSLLAAVQIQAFTRLAYLRLALVGVLGVAGVVGAFVVWPGAEERLLAVAAVLGASFVVLLTLPAGARPGDGVVSLAEWLRRLRVVGAPVRVSRLTFDERYDARGTPVERRRAEGWRRREVGKRLGLRLRRAGGAAAWISPTQLWCFAPAPAEPRLIDAGAGLIAAPAETTYHPHGAQAASSLAAEALGTGRFSSDSPVSIHVADVLADFRRRFPTGIVYDVSGPVPAAMTRFGSRERVAIYRAALLFARDLRRGSGASGFEVTALDLDGALRAIFIADRSAPQERRRAWRHALRALTLRAAAGMVVPAAGPAGVTAEAPMV